MLADVVLGAAVDDIRACERSREARLMATGPAKWGPRFSFFGILGGVLATMGLLVLLQQAGRVYPTSTVALLSLLGGIVIGILLPSLGVLIAVRRANRRYASSGV